MPVRQEAVQFRDPLAVDFGKVGRQQRADDSGGGNAGAEVVASGFEVVKLTLQGRVAQPAGDRVDQVGQLAFGGGEVAPNPVALAVALASLALPLVVERGDERRHDLGVHQVLAHRRQHLRLQP